MITKNRIRQIVKEEYYEYLHDLKKWDAEGGEGSRDEEANLKNLRKNLFGGIKSGPESDESSENMQKSKILTFYFVKYNIEDDLNGAKFYTHKGTSKPIELYSIGSARQVADELSYKDEGKFFWLLKAKGEQWYDENYKLNIEYEEPKVIEKWAQFGWGQIKQVSL